jgi:glycosyltransferase involved in cell wall biosynthesis
MAVDVNKITYKVALLYPENEKCGVHDYSLQLLASLKKQSHSKSKKVEKKSEFNIIKIPFSKSNNPLYYIGFAKKLSGQFDLIHLQHEFAEFGLFGLNFVFFALAIKKPLIVTFHEFHTKPLLYVKEKIITFLLKQKISSIIILSKHTLSQSKKFFPQSKINYSGFGIKSNQMVKVVKSNFKRKLETKIIIHPGFVRENKNQLFTVSLAKKMPQHEFVIAGGGKSSYYEKVLAESRGVKNLKITGYLSKKQYFKIMVKANLVILPYLDVSQSAVFFDAISYSKPVLTSKLDFFSEMGREKISYVSELNNDFVLNINKILKSDKKFLFSEIKKFVSNNSFDEVAKKNIKVYQRVASCQK